MYLEKESLSSPGSASPEPQNETEKTPATPEEFIRLRKDINAEAIKPLEERFSEEEILELLRPTEDDERNFRKRVQENPDTDEIDTLRKKYIQAVQDTLGPRILELAPGQVTMPGDIVLESGKVLVPGVITGNELLELIQKFGIPLERNRSIPSAEVFELPFPCKDEGCIKLSKQIESIYKGFGDDAEVKPSGDYLKIKRELTKTGSRIDLLLLDAQSHGAKAMPLAMLAASFLRTVEDEESRETIMALDAYLASLRIREKEASLIKIALEEEENSPTKKFSFMRAGEAFAFWVEGDKDAGYVVKIVADISIKKGDGIEIAPFADNSSVPPVGDGAPQWEEAISGRLSPQVFDIPAKAAVFLASDGIFDMRNRQTGKQFKQHFAETCQRVLAETKGMEQEYVERRLFEALQLITKEYEQTDDITVVKLAA